MGFKAFIVDDASNIEALAFHIDIQYGAVG